MAERVRRFWTVGQLANLLGMSSPAVREWCREGSLDGAFTTPGGTWLIPPATVQPYLDALHATTIKEVPKIARKA